MERMKTSILPVLQLLLISVTTTTAVIGEWDQPITFNGDANTFWPDQPGLWFNDTQEKLANELIEGLGNNSLTDIEDILADPPAMKYDALKARLTAVQIRINGEDDYDWLMRVFTVMELGDQKPSGLLQRMRNLAKYSRVDVLDATILRMWMKNLTKNMRIALVIRKTMREWTLEDLAAVADKLMELSLIQNQLLYVQGHMKPSELLTTMKMLDSDTPEAVIHRTLIKAFPSFVGNAVAVWESLSYNPTLESLAVVADKTILLKKETDSYVSKFQELLNVEHNYGNQNPSTFLEIMRSLTENMTSFHVWMYYLPEYMRDAIIVKKSLNASSTVQDLTELADEIHDLV